MRILSHFILSHFETIVFFLLIPFVGFYVGRRKEIEKKGREQIEKAVKSQTNEPLTLHPEVDPSLCAGCGSCTVVCPEGDILKLVDHKAVLVAPTKCVGHGECEKACPFDAIKLVFGTKTRGLDIPRLNSNYETNVPGLYIAGELGGMGLIRNAIKQGVAAAEDALNGNSKAHSDSQSKALDVLIVGAGPAGVAAAMTATSRNANYLVIEQGSYGGTVANFPRQKIVMSHPAELPLAGLMRFSDNKTSKENLIEYWQNLRSRYSLKVQEGTQFKNLKFENGLFHVETNRGEIKAQKVILALGVRGSPRKLGLENEDLAKVTYNLLDPDQYQQKDIAVVGGGNAGVEAAQYLAKAQLGNRVTLLVRGATFDRCNEENQNIIYDLEKKGLVKIWFDSSVQKISETNLTIKKAEQTVELKNDYLFVFAGAEMPHKFLMSLGVQIDKKFGEAIKKAT